MLSYYSFIIGLSFFCKSNMNSIVITFDKIKELLYKVSIQESKTSKRQKGTRTETELPVLVSVFQRITLVSPTVRISPIMAKPSKMVMSHGPWLSKYA